jgi:cell division septation protein DedD
MKWVFSSLVVLNVAFFLWVTGHWLPQQAARQAQRPSLSGEAMGVLAADVGTSSPSEIEEDEPEPSPVPGADADEAGGCLAVGPFSEPKAADHAARLLEGMDLAYRRTTARERIVEGYRVLVGPLPSLAAAEAMRKRLSAMGLTDHYIIQSGLENAVALGFFSQQDKAKQFVADLASKGIKAKLKPRVHDVPQAVWLELPSPGPNAQIQQQLKDAQWIEPSAGVRRRPCPSG